MSGPEGAKQPRKHRVTKMVRMLRGAQQSSGGADQPCEITESSLEPRPAGRVTSRQDSDKEPEGHQLVKRVRSKLQGGYLAVPSDKEVSSSQENAEQSGMVS